jgi:hypothetical protein
MKDKERTKGIQTRSIRKGKQKKLQEEERVKGGNIKR